MGKKGGGAVGREGSITVFLALLLSVLVALVAAALESVRVASGRTHILNGVDVGLYSLFAQYDRELLERYEIFGLHPAAPSDEVPVGKAYEIFEKYMDPLLRVRGIDMEIELGGVSGYTLLTDQGGQIFRQQAVKRQEEALGQQSVEWALDQVRTRSKSVQDQEQAWEDIREGEALNEYDQAVDQAVAEEEVWESEGTQEGSEGESFQEEEGFQVEKGHQDPVENPIQTIRELMNRGILQLVLEDPQDVSWVAMDTSQMVSNRERRTGFGMGVSPQETSPVERYLFQRYVLEKMGHYRNPGQGEMRYQTEYVLYGRSSDGENLKAAANRLLLIREGLNLIHLLSDPAKRAQAQSLALSIASAFLFPPASVIIETAIIVCWAFGESVLDLRELFAGGKIGLWKNAQTWQLSLENLAHLPELLENGHRGDDEGLSYEEYLQVLLFLEDENTQVLRAMDQMELGLQSSKGSSLFRLDHCIGALEVEVEVRVQNQVLTVTRQYGY